MEKNILEQYMDACALIRETEEDIRKLEKKGKTVLSDSVGGSNPEYPYERRTFKIAGTAMTFGDDARLRREREHLEAQRQQALALKDEVDAWMLTQSMRVQRIVRKRVFKGESWAKIAHSLGGRCTADSVRMEFDRLFAKK